MAPKPVRSIFSVFFEYDTPRIVHIKSKKVGVINRLLQLTIIGYVIGFAIVYKKGYQEFDNVQSSVTTKVKGVVFTNLTDVPGIGARIWDVADYVVPSQENAAFFVTTNAIVTPNQTQSHCDEDPSMPDVICQSDSDCTAGEPVVTGNGVRTGLCVNSTQNTTLKVCEIYAWCPVENPKDPNLPKEPVLKGSKNFTVFIKNNIEFPKFSVKRRNLPSKANDTYLQSCKYNSATDNSCPIFQLDTIVKESNNNYDEMAAKGGVIEIIIRWDCNLDYSLDNCVPEYEFRRLDSSDYTISKGYNFRYANYYMEDSESKRTLYKAYGILFIVNVMGRAGKFNVVPLLMNVGSGLALLSVATIICDIVVLYVLKARTLYKEKKYLTVKGDDAYEIMEEETNESAAKVENGTPRKRTTVQDGSLAAED
ncbi:P2X purinoceptor 4-like isoform X2 [Liolophura sinensis]|uniref:P2X purinoceptor 4-like isoform X2 n=1 Tax=Liolophura sinensis TaxID=3198878 RepID=UPI0031584717